MKVAVLCEFSGIVRNAFIKQGYDAISCDLEDTEIPGPHIKGDYRNYDWSNYDLIIAHPPCTFLSNVANNAMKKDVTGERKIKRFKAFDFFMHIWNLPVKKICIENPVGYMNSHFQKPDQTIHPYFFGDREMKRTCLWLKNLPKLFHFPIDSLVFKKTHTKKPEPIAYVKSGKRKDTPLYYMDKCNTYGKNRGKERSRTFPGIANAMVEQWGKLK